MLSSNYEDTYMSWGYLLFKLSPEFDWDRDPYPLECKEKLLVVGFGGIDATRGFPVAFPVEGPTLLPLVEESLRRASFLHRPGLYARGKGTRRKACAYLFTVRAHGEKEVIWKPRMREWN
ncbi:unnamed protein product [Linum trigynum]|uniref:Uncharacterized protein n=1 Tax=Linum trigynum TaxID=586398 RepID=A0AAV2F8N5_9ROSI